MSSLTRSVHHVTKINPYELCRIGDMGDVAFPWAFDLEKSHADITRFYETLREADVAPLSAGGDHSISLPILRAIAARQPVGMVHIDAHTDTCDEELGSRFTHGTPFRRAAEEKLFLESASIHVGIRGPLYSRDDLKNDKELGFKVIHCDEFQSEGIDHVAKRIRDRVGDNPMYLSIDIDVLDPAHAPGTGTPEIAGMSSRELVGVLRGLAGLNIISADVVEVSPAYDHAELTSLSAATTVFEITNLFAYSRKQKT